MNTQRPFVSLLGFALLATASAKLPPKGPLLVEAPVPSIWTIDYAYDQADGKDHKSSQESSRTQMQPAERIVSVRIEKTGTIYHQVVTYSAGAKTENWEQDGVQLCKNANSNSYIFVSTDNPLHTDFDRNDFGCFSWIGPDNYVSGGRQGEQNTNVFEVKNSKRRLTPAEKAELALLAGSIPHGVDEHDKGHDHALAVKQATDQYLESKFGATTSRAVIDADTHLPIEYSDGFSVRTYHFLLKAEISDMPVGVVEELERRKSTRGADLSQPPPP